MNSTIKKIVTASMLAALCCVATMVIKIPSPIGGYLNIGDSVVLLSGFVLPPFYGFLAAGVGSALADIFSPYAVYAPATFIIKGTMALIFCLLFKLLKRKTRTVTAVIISGCAAEVFMVAGYFVFESFLYGILPSVPNIPANAIQGACGLVLGAALCDLFKRHNIFM